MTKLAVYKCDACDKTFGARDEKGEILAIGGMHGFFVKQVIDPATKALQPKLMQYDLDFCEACNKKLMDFAMKELKIK